MSDTTQPDSLTPLIVVILNYRTPGLAIDCLRSLVGEVRLLPSTSVVVSDNASGDGSCWYVPKSRVVYLVGQSSGVTDTKRLPTRLPAYWFDSRRRYFLKNHGWLCAALADATRIFGFTLLRWRRVIQRKPQTDPPKLFSDFLLNSVFLKGGKV